MARFPKQSDFTPAELLSRAWYYRRKAEITLATAYGNALLRLAECYEKMALRALDGREDRFAELVAAAVAKPNHRQTRRHRKPHDAARRPAVVRSPMASRQAAAARDREDVTPLQP